MAWVLENSSLVLILLSGAILMVSLWHYKSSDPYLGLFHLPLNRLPGQDESVAPTTEWLNMGLWKDTSVFPEACEALAKLLISKADLKPGGRILDVGHGTGESLVLLLTDPSIPQLGSLTGITSLELHHQRSRSRVERMKLNEGDTTVSLYHGDAVYTQNERANHPLRSGNGSKFDAVFALDCAYHFHTREDFLGQVFAHLAPGGRIALADICFDGDALKRPSWVRKLLRLMPSENMISKEQYVEKMQEIGYMDVKLEDISADVFPGFMNFLRIRGIGWDLFSRVLSLYVNQGGARFVIVSGTRL